LPAFFAPTSNLRAAFHRLRGVLVGPGTEIGYEVLIDNLYPEMVQIGRDVTIAARATILAHDDAMAYAWGRPEVVRPTRIEDRAFIGVGATILAGVTIGARSIVGAGSVVVEDVEPDSVVAGVPARLVRKRDGP
jgi:acetyltransferase-like isoleucine patch superfamily enzyme